MDENHFDKLGEQKLIAEIIEKDNKKSFIQSLIERLKLMKAKVQTSFTKKNISSGVKKLGATALIASMLVGANACVKPANEQEIETLGEVGIEPVENPADQYEVKYDESDCPFKSIMGRKIFQTDEFQQVNSFIKDVDEEDFRNSKYQLSVPEYYMNHFGISERDAFINTGILRFSYSPSALYVRAYATNGVVDEKYAQVTLLKYDISKYIAEDLNNINNIKDSLRLKLFYNSLLLQEISREQPDPEVIFEYYTMREPSDVKINNYKHYDGLSPTFDRYWSRLNNGRIIGFKIEDEEMIVYGFSDTIKGKTTNGCLLTQTIKIDDDLKNLYTIQDGKFIIRRFPAEKYCNDCEILDGNVIAMGTVGQMILSYNDDYVDLIEKYGTEAQQPKI